MHTSGLWHLSFPPLSEGASLTEPQLLEEFSAAVKVVVVATSALHG